MALSSHEGDGNSDGPVDSNDNDDHDVDDNDDDNDGGGEDRSANVGRLWRSGKRWR
jgi:hypothetical protein